MSQLRKVIWVDLAGRKHLRLIPTDAPDSSAEFGIPAGVPSLARLGLPKAVEVRLHNSLHERGIFNEKLARNARGAVQGALMAALQLDAIAIIGCFKPLTGDTPEP